MITNEIILSLINFDFTFQVDYLDKIKAIGLNNVEVFYRGHDNFLKTREQLTRNGFIIRSVHMQKDFFMRSDYEINDMLSELRKTISYTPNVSFLFHPNGERVFEYLDELASYGVSVCFENTIEDAEQLIEMSNRSGNFHIVFDVAHCSYYSSHLSLLNTNKIKYAHIRGYNKQNYVSIAKSCYEHLLIIKTLLQNFDIPLVLENQYSSIPEIASDYIYLKRLLNEKNDFLSN